MDVWLRVHESTHAAFINRLNDAVGISQLEAYPVIIGALVSMLQATQYELYEVDCLLGSNFVNERCTSNRSNTNKLVAYVDNFAMDNYKATGVFLLQERLNAYLDVACTEKLPLVIKNYSSEVISIEDSTIKGNEPLASLLKQLKNIVILEIVSVPPMVTIK